MSLIARKSFAYDGRNLAKGDEFDARSQKDSRVLRMLGKARAIVVPPMKKPEPLKAPGSYMRRDLQAQPPIRTPIVSHQEVDALLTPQTAEPQEAVRESVPAVGREDEAPHEGA